MTNLTSIPLTNGIPTGGTGSVSTIDALMQTAAIAVTPTVTASNSYGAGYIIGGLLTFSNAFLALGSGILQCVRVTCKTAQTGGFTFFPFNANPSSSTWTDCTAAALNTADTTKMMPPINLGTNNLLGTPTIMSAVGIGQSMNIGATTLYGVLLSNGSLSNQFGSTSDITIEITVLQD